MPIPCLAIFIPLMIQSHDADTNVGLSREHAQNTCSGKITGHTSCGSRVSKCRMYSTSILGLALLRNDGTTVTYHIMKHFFFSTSSERRPHPMIPDFCIDTLIDIFHSETLLQDKVQDARKDTDTHHFGSHSRAKPR